MAIKIRKKVEEEKVIQAAEPEVLPPEGSEAELKAAAEAVKIPGLDDKFLNRSSSAMSWILDHRRMVVLAITLVVLAAVAYLGITHAVEVSDTKLSSDLSPAFVTYTALTREEANQLEASRMAYFQSQGIAADADDILRVSYTVPDNKTRFAAIEKNLEQTLPTLSGETVADSGYLMMAGSAARLGHEQKALDAYDKAAKSKNLDVRLFAALGDAEQRVNMKKYDEAIAQLDNVIAKHPGLTSALTLEKARIYEVSGAVDKAIETYAKFSGEFGREVDRLVAVNRLKYLTPNWQTLVKPAVVPVPSSVPAKADL